MRVNGHCLLRETGQHVLVPRGNGTGEREDALERVSKDHSLGYCGGEREYEVVEHEGAVLVLVDEEVVEAEGVHLGDRIRFGDRSGPAQVLVGLGPVGRRSQRSPAMTEYDLTRENAQLVRVSTRTIAEGTPNFTSRLRIASTPALVCVRSEIAGRPRQPRQPLSRAGVSCHYLLASRPRRRCRE